MLTCRVAEGQGVDEGLPLDGEEQTAPVRTPAAGLTGGHTHTHTYDEDTLINDRPRGSRAPHRLDLIR